MGQLIDELKSLGVYDKALVVLLSDHGEGLGDHGEEEHGVLLYNEAIHVPLILKLPKSQRAGGTTARPVQLLDVTPTVLGLLGLERTEDHARRLAARRRTCRRGGSTPKPFIRASTSAGTSCSR